MLKITEELRDILVAYLSTRPFKEVAQGIDALTNLKKIVESEKPEAKADKK